MVTLSDEEKVEETAAVVVGLHKDVCALQRCCVGVAVDELEDIGEVWMMSAAALVHLSVDNLLSQDRGGSKRFVADLPI